jgi:hypothetical protein
MIILVLAEDIRQEIQSLQVLGNPRYSRMSSKKGQATKSKVLAISIFKSREGHFLK